MGKINKVLDRDSQVLDRLLEIWESAVEATHTFLRREDVERLKPEVMRGLQEVEQLYGYWEEGEILGFMGLEREKIEMLFLHASARGKGIGKQLLQCAVQEHGAKYVDVNEQNAQGAGFYEHMGFQVTARSQLDGQGRPFPILHLEKA